MVAKNIKKSPATVVTKRAPMAFVTSNKVPVPDKGVGRSSHYPWETMKEGESFFVPGKSAASMSTLASSRKKDNPAENYTVREIKDGEPWGKPGEVGCAVWRIPAEASA